jgi:aspartate aminotransferase
MKLSQRAQAFRPSPTMAIDARTKALQAEGRPVINMGVGEPDFPTPEPVAEAGIQAIRDGYTRYTPAGGLPSLKAAIRRRLLADQGLSYDDNQVIVSVGAKHVLYNIFQVLLDPGDEVVIPAPYWVTYPDQVELAGGRPVIVPCGPEVGFKLTPERLAEACGERTVALVLCSPSNPTGAVYSEAELEALVEVALAKGLVIVSDEVYAKLNYTGSRTVSPAELSQAAYEATIVVNAASKTYAMTGWRIGWAAAADRRLVKAMQDLQSQVTSNPAAMAQKAAEYALGLDDALVVAPMVEAFRRRRDLIVELARTLPGFETEVPDGAFYLFPRVRGLYGRTIRGRTIQSGDDVATLLLEEAEVSTVPGSGFGFPDHIRFSFATSDDNIREAFRRIASVLADG